MDVELYVYDLSKGMARQMSRQFLGIHIGAVYHTAVVFGGVEYFFGAGVQTCYPGTTHHGAPMEIIPLGRTDLPLDVILEYLESLKQIYTRESYDLFLHNCNNFSNDFAMFLVGRGIPDHITSLPRTVLNTPFGAMLRTQIDSSMRSITQAPVPSRQVPPVKAATARVTNGASNGTSSRISNGTSTNGVPKTASAASFAPGEVHYATTIEKVDKLLASAKEKCAIIFFTSSTCAPCKIVYPAYDQLAAEAGDKAVFIKIDLNSSDPQIASRYSVRATPTFITLLRGIKQEQWSGANEAQLRGNVQLLLSAAFPPHPHSSLNLTHFHRASLRPELFTRIPPLDKLTAKLGKAANDSAVLAVRSFISTRQSSGAIEAPPPDLPAFGAFLRRATEELPAEVLFAAYDLLRVSLVDARVAGFFAEEAEARTLRCLVGHVNALGQGCPYNLRIVTLQLSCNLFASPLFRKFLLADAEVSELLTTLVASSLLDSQHVNVRVAAMSLALNLASAAHRVRMEEKREALPESAAVELVASVLEALAVEQESKEVVRGLVLALGFLVYMAPEGGEVLDLCKVMDAEGTVRGKEGLSGGDAVVKEVGREMLGKGLRTK
ncbi:hypothetical protein W97_08855 [Coniosporium apollinis CBS 100218]|uniref:Thioredoxin n=1 Tax=Coniosporium apollinis (strain CBS 100218) TaxID=1168221 RepID=R7Z607_CONA1|nr:uncharacterized protein W97_08855 [Coniosporium apollinis CBS 100218]EON69595.1 hypothetical protein W97_08855 [Coniosporium apollinis CBS 100218]